MWHSYKEPNLKGLNCFNSQVGSFNILVNILPLLKRQIKKNISNDLSYNDFDISLPGHLERCHVMFWFSMPLITCLNHLKHKFHNNAFAMRQIKIYQQLKAKTKKILKIVSKHNTTPSTCGVMLCFDKSNPNMLDINIYIYLFGLICLIYLCKWV